MLEEIETGLYISHNFSFQFEKDIFRLFLKFIKDDYKIAKEYFSRLNKSELSITALPLYLQEYFVNKLYSKKQAVLFNRFIKEISTALKFNLMSDHETGSNVREQLYELFFTHLELIQSKVLIRKVPGEILPDRIYLPTENIFFRSEKLAQFFKRYLSTRDKIFYVYIATIGDGIDKKVAEMNNNGDIYEAYLLNSIGAGIAEILSEDLTLYFSDLLKHDIRRYSPGYNKWELSEQAKLFSLLKYPELIKVKLTENFMMLPEKTTSGVMA